jgi:hypothetical protein
MPVESSPRFVSGGGRNSLQTAAAPTTLVIVCDQRAATIRHYVALARYNNGPVTMARNLHNHDLDYCYGLPYIVLDKPAMNGSLMAAAY